MVRHIKSSTSESSRFAAVLKPKFPARPFLIDSDAELFMYLIKCIKFGS